MTDLATNKDARDAKLYIIILNNEHRKGLSIYLITDHDFRLWQTQPMYYPPIRPCQNDIFGMDPLLNLTAEILRSS